MTPSSWSQGPHNPVEDVVCGVFGFVLALGWLGQLIEIAGWVLQTVGLMR